jgi:hypothetical protein
VSWTAIDTILPGPTVMDMILSRSYNKRGDRKWWFDIPEFDAGLKVVSVADSGRSNSSSHP